MNNTVVVELAGPLVDDGGAFSRTPADVAAAAGVELSERFRHQVDGGHGPWALETILVGHGRDDIMPRISGLAADLAARWDAIADRGAFAPVRGASEWIAAVEQSGRRLHVVTQLPVEVACKVLERVGMAALKDRLVAIDPPRSEILAGIVASNGGPSGATALVFSPAVAMAAIGARVGEVILVGGGSSAAANLPVDRVVSSVRDIST